MRELIVPKVEAGQTAPHSLDKTKVRKTIRCRNCRSRFPNCIRRMRSALRHVLIVHDCLSRAAVVKDESHVFVTLVRDSARGASVAASVGGASYGTRTAAGRPSR